MKTIVYYRLCRDGIYFDKILVSEYKLFKRSNKANLLIALVHWPVSQMKMTFQKIRIISTGSCISNQLRNVNTICRRSWYIAAHIWKIYDFKRMHSYYNMNILKVSTSIIPSDCTLVCKYRFVTIYLVLKMTIQRSLKLFAAFFSNLFAKKTIMLML